jgi:hypothetical protein
MWYRVGYGDLATGIRGLTTPPLFGTSSNTPAAVVSTVVGTTARGTSDHRRRREHGLGGARPGHRRHTQARLRARGIFSPDHRRRAQEGSDRGHEGALPHTTAAATSGGSRELAPPTSVACRRPPVVWTSLGPLPRWVPGPTTRWAPVSHPEISNFRM